MNERLEMEVVLSTLRAAFVPLRCGVEAFDYGQKIRFRVFSSDHEPLVSMSSMDASAAQDFCRLEGAIREVRSRVTRKGFVLDPWHMPFTLAATVPNPEV